MRSRSTPKPRGGHAKSNQKGTPPPPPPPPSPPGLTTPTATDRRKTRSNRCRSTTPQPPYPTALPLQTTTPVGARAPTLAGLSGRTNSSSTAPCQTARGLSPRMPAASPGGVRLSGMVHRRQAPEARGIRATAPGKGHGRRPGSEPPPQPKPPARARRGVARSSRERLRRIAHGAPIDRDQPSDDDGTDGTERSARARARDSSGLTLAVVKRLARSLPFRSCGLMKLARPAAGVPPSPGPASPSPSFSSRSPLLPAPLFADGGRAVALPGSLVR